MIFPKESIILMVTAVRSRSWGEAVSTGELIEARGRLAIIKFTDVSRVAGGYKTFGSRRRSGFHFVLYGLRK